MIKSYKQLNINWNADPNAPEPTLVIDNRTVNLEFYLNSFLYEQYEEGDKGLLSFSDVCKMSFNFMNDEGYYRGQYRYTSEILPWGNFYEVGTNWKIDFPDFNVMYHSTNIKGEENFKHYIFFLRDNTFECVAKSHTFSPLIK